MRDDQEGRVTQINSSGYIALFSSLSFFCFLFCMALDIFIKFRRMNPHTDKWEERKKV